MSKTYKNLLRRALSTVLIIGSVAGFSACKANVTSKPINIPDTTQPKVSTTVEKQPETKLPVSSTIDTSKETTPITSVKEEIPNTPGINDQTSKYYSTREQVETISEALGAKSDILYRLAYDNKTNRKTIRRMEHNLDEPLKIAVHSNLSENTKNIAKKQLDNIFNIVGEINNNYKYEFVEYNENDKDDYDILFENRNGYWNGMVGEFNTNYKDGCAYNNHCIIYLNEESINNSNNNINNILLEETILHELMHVFGFSDVYLDDDLDHKDATTILYSSSSLANNFSQTNITPNDYKNLISLYAKPSKNLEQDIEKYREMSDKYTNEYYKQWALDNFKNTTSPTQGINSGIYTFNKDLYLNKPNNNRENCTFTLEINNNNYKLTVKKSNGEILETSTGNIKYLSIPASSNGKPIINAMAIMEGFQSKYIYEDIFNDLNYSTGFYNIVLYNSDGQFIIKDARGSLNKSTPEFHPLEQDLEM